MGPINVQTLDRCRGDESVDHVSSQSRSYGAATWAGSLVATVVSAWALDGVAVAVGLFLAASNVLNGAPHGVVLGVLAATYVLWVAGLRANVMANWRLLDATATSTNVLSKIAFELARLRSSSQRTQRVASAVGYVGTEIAKEVPFYAGAFGAALVSDSVDTTDALVFLAGTNIGAALYEYSVARLTGTYLDRRSLVRRGP
ncbi:MAG: hypothetical protein M3337_09005 [Actinomycetota bacterium]|nr:hypothetical protein [Actinomycetota bacterium]